MLESRRRSRSVGPWGKPVVRVVRSPGQLQVWLCENGELQSLTGTVNAALASDAERHGQDLVGELIDRTLREVERRSSEAAA
jgi:hypothetical protein